jgi:hypothetical protein
VELLWILVRSSSYLAAYREWDGLMVGMELILGNWRLLLGSAGMWVSLLVSRGV